MSKPRSSAPAAELLAAIERVRRLSNRLSRQLDEQLGISIYQAGILAAVDDGARHLHEVASATGQQVSGASRLVERAVRDGLLERRSDPTDRRAVLLAMTDAGDALLRKARELVGQQVSGVLEQMPEREAQQLLPALNSFLDTADVTLDQPREGDGGDDRIRTGE